MSALRIEETLITWDELKERKKNYERFQKCGVACPECGAELLVDTMMSLATYPPRRGYHCLECTWHGTA